ncbi:hypothetical protein SAMN05216386_0778 [Nitrosospira briensis]|uniref:Uncharacterized protein n=1 Tax=Nitrosospira briensis TaxID=35799 RepID=A0A1I4YMD0_9PROT|nr:hypothetical protein [Nitrosospira briensis]SFN39222.1 hypothetical protein SAMN05216386_0778 [Nitrosospira briensis]
MIKTFKTLVFVAVSIGLMTSCSTMHEATRSQRTPVEQLLISEAVLRSLPATADGSLPIPPGSSVILDTSGISIAAGISSDQTLLQKILTGWLGRQGYSVQKSEEKATHRVNVIVQALGTELGNSFFGMPPVRSQIIPFSLPELALYKAEYQTGYVKFYMDIFELPSGAFVQSTPAYLAETYYNGHTVLLIFSFTSTDLDFPPQLGSYRKPNVSNMLE